MFIGRHIIRKNVKDYKGYCCKKFEYCVHNQFIKNTGDKSYYASFSDELWIEHEEGEPELVDSEIHSEDLDIIYCPFCGSRL